MSVVRRPQFTLMLLLFCAGVPCPKAALVRPTRDANEIAHNLFGRSAKAVTVNSSISGPEGSIGMFSGSSNDEATGQRSGVVLSTGDAKSAAAWNSRAPATPPAASAGDEQLSQLAGVNTQDAATISLDFHTAPDIKNLRIKLTFVSQESSARLQQGFDDVFAIFIDGELVQFARGSETREPDAQRNSSLAGKNVRVVNTSKLIDVSKPKNHSMKLAIANVGDSGGNSFALISIEGEEEHPPFIARASKVMPPPQPPGPPPPPEPPVKPEDKLPPIDRFEPSKTTTPVVPSLPPPPYLEMQTPIKVPDRGSSLLLSSLGFFSLLIARFVTSRSEVGRRECP